jgi:ornithine cyclodeaminase/alanine dehydrogenase
VRPTVYITTAGGESLVLILTRQDIRRVLTMGDAISAVEDAFRELSSGAAVMPTRIGLSIPEKDGWMGAMPAYLGRTNALVTKIVTSYGGNPSKHNLPTVMAIIVLNNPETGKPEAVLEGGFITAVRTGAASGVATKYLARKDARVVGIFGAGTQARTQLEAIREVRDVRSAIVYDIIKERAERFAEEMSSSLGIGISAVGSPERALEGSDVVVTASTSKTPVFDGDNLKEGTHINAIGSFTPDARELDDSTVRRSKIVVDSLQAALAEAGDIVIPMRSGAIQRSQIYAELGEIVAGIKPGRTDDREITVFKSVGLAVQDAAAARLAYMKAREAKIGTDIELM